MVATYRNYISCNHLIVSNVPVILGSAEHPLGQPDNRLESPMTHYELTNGPVKLVSWLIINNSLQNCARNCPFLTITSWCSYNDTAKNKTCACLFKESLERCISFEINVFFTIIISYYFVSKTSVTCYHNPFLSKMT